MNIALFSLCILALKRLSFTGTLVREEDNKMCVQKLLDEHSTICDFQNMFELHSYFCIYHKQSYVSCASVSIYEHPVLTLKVLVVTIDALGHFETG